MHKSRSPGRLGYKRLYGGAKFFNIIITIPCCHCLQKFISVHLNRAETADQWSDSQDTTEFWVISEEFAACHHSGVYNLEATSRFLENLWIPGLRIVTHDCWQSKLAAIGGKGIVEVKMVAVGVRVIRWDKNGTHLGDNFAFLYGE